MASRAPRVRGLFEIVEMKMDVQQDDYAPTRMETIKAKCDACEMGYDEALARLEALGMWAEHADDYLIPRQQVRR